MIGTINQTKRNKSSAGAQRYAAAHQQQQQQEAFVTMQQNNQTTGRKRTKSASGCNSQNKRQATFAAANWNDGRSQMVGVSTQQQLFNDTNNNNSDSVWVFGLINNIEQMLSSFNAAHTSNSSISS